MRNLGILGVTALAWLGIVGQGVCVAPLNVNLPWFPGATFSPDKRYILVPYSGYGGWTSLFDATTGKELWRSIYPGYQKQRVAFLPDGRHLLVPGGDDARAMSYPALLDLPSGKVVRTFVDCEPGFTSLAITPDGKWALSGHWDGRILVWDVASGRRVRAFDARRYDVLSGEFLVANLLVTPDGKEVIAHIWKHLKRWDFTTGKELPNSLAAFDSIAHSLFGRSADGRLLCCGRTCLDRADPMLTVWDLRSGKPVGSFTGHTDYISDAALTPDGKQVISVSWDQTMRRWDLATGREVWRIDLGKRASTGAIISADGSRALTQEGFTLLLWDLEARKVLWKWPPPAPRPAPVEEGRTLWAPVTPSAGPVRR